MHELFFKLFRTLVSIFFVNIQYGNFSWLSRIFSELVEQRTEPSYLLIRFIWTHKNAYNLFWQITSIWNLTNTPKKEICIVALSAVERRGEGESGEGEGVPGEGEGASWLDDEGEGRMARLKTVRARRVRGASYAEG